MDRGVIEKGGGESRYMMKADLGLIHFPLCDLPWQELGCDELPPGLCRPSMGAIAPRVTRACRRFPVVAEHIVKANGLDPEEFNRYEVLSIGAFFAVALVEIPL